MPSASDFRLVGPYWMPAAAVTLWLELEASGFRLTAQDGALVVQPASRLTPDQLAACRRFKWHLLAIVGERLDVVH